MGNSIIRIPCENLNHSPKLPKKSTKTLEGIIRSPKQLLQKHPPNKCWELHLWTPRSACYRTPWTSLWPEIIRCDDRSASETWHMKSTASWKILNICNVDTKKIWYFGSLILWTLAQFGTANALYTWTLLLPDTWGMFWAYWALGHLNLLRALWRLGVFVPACRSRGRFEVTWFAAWAANLDYGWPAPYNLAHRIPMVFGIFCLQITMKNHLMLRKNNHKSSCCYCYRCFFVEKKTFPHQSYITEKKEFKGCQSTSSAPSRSYQLESVSSFKHQHDTVHQFTKKNGSFCFQWIGCIIYIIYIYTYVFFRNVRFFFTLFMFVPPIGFNGWHIPTRWVPPRSSQGATLGIALSQDLAGLNSLGF